MNSGTFKPRIPPKPENKRAGEFASHTAKPRPTAPVALAGLRVMVLSRPKPEPARPGKRTPTVAEAAWMRAITEFGCIACHIDGHPGTPGAVHHLLRGGRRIGHTHSICLCDPGHHQDGQRFGKVSRHPWKTRFEKLYGTEEELLSSTRHLVLVEGATL